MFTYKIPDELIEQVNKYREEYRNCPDYDYSKISEISNKLADLIDTEFSDKECIVGIKTTYRPSSLCILDTTENILTEDIIVEHEDLYNYYYDEPDIIMNV